MGIEEGKAGSEDSEEMKGVDQTRPGSHQGGLGPSCGSGAPTPGTFYWLRRGFGKPHDPHADASATVHGDAAVSVHVDASVP